MIFELIGVNWLFNIYLRHARTPEGVDGHHT